MTHHDREDDLCVGCVYLRRYGLPDDFVLKDHRDDMEARGRAKPPAGWREYGTGGGCMALEMTEPDGSYYLITEWDEPDLPKKGKAAVLGYYNDGGEQVWARRIPRYTTPEAAFERRGQLRTIGAVGADPCPRCEKPLAGHTKEQAARCLKGVAAAIRDAKLDPDVLLIADGEGA